MSWAPSSAFNCKLEHVADIFLANVYKARSFVNIFTQHLFVQLASQVNYESYCDCFCILLRF